MPLTRSCGRRSTARSLAMSFALAFALAFALVASIAVAPPLLRAQQLPDRDFRPPVPRPAFESAKGPRLCLDEAHHNFHTLADRFWAFGELARRDGYRVGPLRLAFTATSLSACDLLVISNTQWSGADWSKYPTPTPSAFTEGEIAAVSTWVERGGSRCVIHRRIRVQGRA